MKSKFWGARENFQAGQGWDHNGNDSVEAAG